MTGLYNCLLPYRQRNFFVVLYHCSLFDFVNYDMFAQKMPKEVTDEISATLKSATYPQDLFKVHMVYC